MSQKVTQRLSQDVAIHAQLAVRLRPYTCCFIVLLFGFYFLVFCVFLISFLFVTSSCSVFALTPSQSVYIYRPNIWHKAITTTKWQLTASFWQCMAYGSTLPIHRSINRLLAHIRRAWRLCNLSFRQLKTNHLFLSPSASCLCSFCFRRLWELLHAIWFMGRRCHIKMSFPCKIRPDRNNHEFDMSPLIKISPASWKSPNCRIAPRKVSPCMPTIYRQKSVPSRRPPGGADFCR